MGDRDRVVVDIDHAGVGVDRVDHLVDVAHGRDAGPDVDELVHALARDVADRPSQEGPVGLHHRRQLRPHLDGFLGHPAVDREVV